MEQNSIQTIAELETTLIALHRGEMRLRSVLSSALVSPDNRQDARAALEALLEETREIEGKVRQLETNR
jgi:hypothetical protein